MYTRCVRFVFISSSKGVVFVFLGIFSFSSINIEVSGYAGSKNGAFFQVRISMYIKFARVYRANPVLSTRKKGPFRVWVLSFEL